MKLTHLLTKRILPLKDNSFNIFARYCTATAATTTKRAVPKGNKQGGETESLYRRITPVGDPNKSVIPILDQWVSEGKHVDKPELRRIIYELRHYRRLKHALEISQWMTEKRNLKPNSLDVAVRLNLIAKVHGLEQAEKFFNDTPMELRTIEVYGALLSCYTLGKCVEKAEATMEKIRELVPAPATINYNQLLNLYLQIKDSDKLDALMDEMEEKKIKFGKHSYVTLLKGYGAASDIGGMEKILSKMESDREVDIDWYSYFVVADIYLNAGLISKGAEFLKKSEKLIPLAKRKNEACFFLMSAYTKTGNKEDVLRIWNYCKNFRVNNMSYMSILSSILKLDDLETAKEIFKEWEASDLNKDVRVPNYLISFYCKKLQMDEAEALIEKVYTKNWEKPNVFTWSWMTEAYVNSNQMPKAIKAMESSLSLASPGGRWKPQREVLMACLKHLKEEGDIDRCNGFARVLTEKCVVSGNIQTRLVEYLTGNSASEDVLGSDYEAAKGAEHMGAPN